jgi:hypothetical protein
VPAHALAASSSEASLLRMFFILFTSSLPHIFKTVDQTSGLALFCMPEHDFLARHSKNR